MESWEAVVMQCIKTDNLEIFTSLVHGHKNCNVNSFIGAEQQPILFLAILKQAKSITRYLLSEHQELGVHLLDVNTTNAIHSTALHVAASVNCIEAGMLLLNHPNFCKLNDRDIYGNHALHVAVKCNHSDFVSLLVSIANVDVNVKRVGCGKTALHLAIEEAQPQLVTLLLQEMNASVYHRNHQHMPPCFYLPLSSHQKKAAAIILDQLVVTDVEFLCKAKDQLKQNMLHKIVLANNVFVLRAFALLVSEKYYQSALNECDIRGNTPIHYACLQGNCNILETLLLMQPNLKIADANGDSVFHLAAKLYDRKKEINRYRICKILYESEQGSLILKLKNAKHETVEQLLQKAEFFEDYLCFKSGFNKLLDEYHLSENQIQYFQQIAPNTV